MKIYLPNSAFLGNIDRFLKRFDPASPDRLAISSHSEWIAVHPVVLSMVAALAITVPKGNIQCEKLEAKSKGYLARMGLLRILGLPDIPMMQHESAGRFIPITQIRTSSEATKFIAEMIPLLKVERAHAETIVHIISELLRNTLEHSQSPLGAMVCAQWYPKSNSVKIGIADTGVGIKQTINFSYPAATDIEAIRLALEPGVTGTTRRFGGTEQNAGFGLFFIKSIASTNRDFFVMYSGRGFYKLLKKPLSAKRAILHMDAFKDKHAHANEFPCWRGTVVGIDINLAHKQELSKLLSAIGSMYREAIKEKKKAMYKRPQFI